MPSIYEGNLSKTMVKQSNRNTLAKKRAEKIKRDKEKYPLPFNIKEGMNSTIRQTSPELRAKDNQRTMVTNLIMDKYKMPYDEAKAAYEDVLVPYQQKRDDTAKRASFIGDKYNLDTLFTSKRTSPGLDSARALENMITPTEGGVVSENPYFKQGVGMEGFLSTTNAGRAVSDPNAPNRYRIAGDADLGRVDTPYNANTFKQQFKDIKAAFEEDPKLMAEIIGMSLAQDYVKTALPIAAGTVGLSGAVMGTDIGKGLNKSVMQFALDNAPVSEEAKSVVGKDWLAPATATSFIDPALTGLGLATGGVTGAFPVTSKLLKAGKAVATSEKAATAGRMSKGAVVGARQGLSQPQGVGMNFADIIEGAAQGALDARNVETRNVRLGTLSNEGRADLQPKIARKTRAPEGETTIDMSLEKDGIYITPKMYKAIYNEDPQGSVGWDVTEDTLVYAAKNTEKNKERIENQIAAAGGTLEPYLTRADYMSTATGAAQDVQKIYDKRKFPALGTLIGKDKASFNEVLDYFGVSGLSATVRSMALEDVDNANALYDLSTGQRAVRVKGKTPHRDHPVSKSGHAYEDVADLVAEIKAWEKSGASKDEIAKELALWVDKKQLELDTILDPKSFVLLDEAANVRAKGSKALNKFMRLGDQMYEDAGSGFRPVDYGPTGLPNINPTMLKYMELWADLMKQSSRFDYNNNTFISAYNEGGSDSLASLLEASRRGGPKGEKAAKEFNKKLDKLLSEQ